MRKAGHGFMTCRLRKFSRWFKWQKKQHFLFIWHTEEKFLVLILTSDGALGSNRGRGQPLTCRATVHGQTHGRGCLRVKRKGLLTSGLKVRASPYPQTSSIALRCRAGGTPSIGGILGCLRGITAQGTSAWPPEILWMLSWGLFWEASRREMYPICSQKHKSSPKSSSPTRICSSLLVIKIQANNYLYKIFSG